MLRINKTKEKIANGEEVFGLLNSIAHPLLCEMIAYAGYDFIVLDTEHLLVAANELEHAIKAAECSGITVLVRIPSGDPALIARALDAGAQGIVIPRVETVDQAEQAIAAVRFPPLGKRGITGGRNTGFGMLSIDNYIQRANSQVLLVIMIESITGSTNLASMLSLEGIDMVLEGALDLSIDMGHGSNVAHQDVQQVLNQIASTCQASRIPFCALPRLPGQTQQWREKGVHCFLAGEDRGIVFKELKHHLSKIRS